MTQKQKIIFTLPGLEAGGAERVLITLMNSLDRSLYEPELISIKGQGPLVNLIDSDIPVHHLNQKLTPLTLLGLYKKLSDLKPNTIVSTMAHMNFAVLGLKIFFPHTKFIIREAITPSFFFEKFPLYSGILKILYKTLYPKADIVLSPTQKVFDEFKDLLHLDLPHKFVLKNSVDVEHIRNQIESFDTENTGIVKFVSCGRLHHQKGFDRLIEALGKHKLPFQWRLDIIGEGEERDSLTQLIQKYNLSNNIFLQGLVIPPYTYFAQADCFLLPSRYEGSPNVVLEALACGTPVIATADAGGIQEIANDCETNFIQIANDMDSFIHKIKNREMDNQKKLGTTLLPACYKNKVSVYNFFELLKKL